MRRAGVRTMAAAIAMTAMLAPVACDRTPTAPLENDAGLIVSDAAAAAGDRLGGARFARWGSSAARQTSPFEEVAWVSLPPGTIPDGGLATIRNPRTGDEVRAAFDDGGFDPVAIPARAGERLDLSIVLIGGGTRALTSTVPVRRRPRVVRSHPVPTKRDVPLNARFTVVFSEPVDPATTSGIRLLHGEAEVGGSIVLAGDDLRAVFTPDALLAPNTEYVLSVPATVSDLQGDPLESAWSAEFTTGTSVATARVATEQAAVLMHPADGNERVMLFDASLDEDGSVTGGYTIFYPGSSGIRVWGTITCFSTSGKAAWVVGRPDSTTGNGTLPPASAWRVLDRTSPGGLPDQLSLAFPIIAGTLTAEEWCGNEPVRDPWYGDIEMIDLVTGDIVVTGEAPPPPLPDVPLPLPPAPGSGPSLIALFSPGGSIEAMTAEGSGYWRITNGPSDFNPAWSPDGRRLAFQRGAAETDIWVVNWDRSGASRLTSGPVTDQDPAWSPDGSRIAFVRDGSLHVMNADGSGVTRLSDTGYDSHPSWSPDGSRIVFASSRTGSNAIHVMRADGTSVVQLTSESAYDFHPSWSPNGQWIAFQRNPYGVGSIWTMRPDGTQLTRVVAGQTPSWSPDGRRIIYELFGITHVAPDGSGMTWLEDGFYPAWQPVGTLPAEPAPFRSIELVDGDGQTGAVFGTLPRPLRVRVVRDDGEPMPNVMIRWNVWWNSGSVRPTLSTPLFATTDADGISAVTLTLGNGLQPVTVRAALADGTAHRGEVIFTATPTMR